MNRNIEYLRARGWSLQKLAEAAGTSKSQIDKLEKGARRLTVDWMLRLAKPLGCDPRDLLPQVPIQNADKKTKPLPGKEFPFGKTAPPSNLIPVRGASQQVVDHVPRPYYLAHARDAYALYMPDDAMVPMYKRRQLLFINPYKPASTGNGVVLIGKKGDWRVREFVRTDGKTVTVREYHPKSRETNFRLSDTIAVHTVAGTVEL